MTDLTGLIKRVFHPRRLKSTISDKRIRGASWLSISALFSALIAIVAVPTLTRLFTPGDFGALALMTAVAATVGTVVSGRYEMVCVVAPHDEAGDVAAWQAARVATALSAAAGLLLAVAAGLVLVVTENLAQPVVVVFGIPIMTALTGVGATQSLLDTRLGNYGVISALALLRSIGTVLGQIWLGHLSATIAALVVPTIVFAALPLARLLVLLRKGPIDRGEPTLDFLRRHRKYPTYQVPAAIANSLSSNILVFALGASYGVGSVGLYSIGTRITTFPSAIVSAPINTVYFREAARLSADRRKSLRMYVGVVLGLTIVGILGFAVLVLLVQPIVGLLGSDWTTATGMILATIPMGLALFITAPANSALIAYGQQAQLLAWRVGLVVVPPLVILAGPSVHWSDATAVAVASVAMLAGTVGYLLWGVRVVSRGHVRTSQPQAP